MWTTRFYHHHGPAFRWESVRFLGKGWLVLGTIFYVNRTRQTRSVLKWRKSQRLAAIQDSTYYVRRHWLKKSSYCRSRCLTRLQPRLQPRPRGSRLRRGIHLFMIRSTCSVTRLGEISPLWENFKSIWATFKSFIYYLAKLRTFFD